MPQGPGRVLSPGLSLPRRRSPLPDPPALAIVSLFSLLGAPPPSYTTPSPPPLLLSFRRWDIKYKRSPLILTCNIGDFFYLLKQLSPCCN